MLPPGFAIPKNPGRNPDFWHPDPLHLGSEFKVIQRGWQMRKPLNGRPVIHRGLGIVSGWFMTGAFLCLCAAYPAYGQDDLLLLPAIKSDRAPFSMLTDVVRTNGGLVAVGERGHVLFRKVEESNWRQADVPVRVNLTAVSFPTDKKGWAVGHDGVVLHSDDGGKHWKKQLDGVKINELMLVQLKKIIDDKKRIFEDETFRLNTEQKEELNLEIESLDFFLQDLETVAIEGPTRPLLDVWFKNEQEGIAVGAYGMILETKDGGQSWVSMMDRIENTGGYHYYGITRCKDDLFIAGEYGMLFRSADFGKSWQRLSSPYEGSFFGIVGKPKGGLVVAFGLRGTIIYSHDRGDTWAFAKAKTRASISGGTFLSDGSLCLVATDGSILHSTDDGKTFTLLPTRFPGTIAATELRNGVLMVGLKGVIRIDLNHLDRTVEDKPL
jgi:photosystem II stability/assembly factor-like uncharacterized protein